MTDTLGNFITLLIVISSFATGVAENPVSADERPNIIVVMTDDQAIWAMGAYGNQEVKTPNMDRLASEGARFTNLYVTTGICVPSRVSYYTGLYPSQVGLTDIVSRMAGHNNGLPSKVPVWPQVLKSQGYATGLVGKWHLGDGRQYFPDQFGIDYFFGYNHGDREPVDPNLITDGDVKPHKGFLPDILTTRALEFIEDNRDGPFALMLNYGAPHWPYGPVPDEDSKPFEDLDPTVTESVEQDFTYIAGAETPWIEAQQLHEDYLKRRMKAYYGAVHSADRNLGRVFSRLRALGLDDNTIIILTSDNGYMVGQRGLMAKSDGIPVRFTMFDYFLTYKNLYDDSIHVPLLVKWPGTIEPGLVIDELVSNIDFFPTILSMLDVEPPKSLVIPGDDFVPLLKQEEVEWKDAVFGIYDSTFRRNVEFLRMIRTKEWKLVKRVFNPNGHELYNLTDDPGEKNNLYYERRNDQEVPYYVSLEDLKYANTIQELQSRLHAWRTEIDDPVLDLEAEYYRKRERMLRQWQ